MNSSCGTSRDVVSLLSKKQLIGGPWRSLLSDAEMELLNF